MIPPFLGTRARAWACEWSADSHLPLGLGIGMNRLVFLVQGTGCVNVRDCLGRGRI